MERRAKVNEQTKKRCKELQSTRWGLRRHAIKGNSVYSKFGKERIKWVEKWTLAYRRRGVLTALKKRKGDSTLQPGVWDRLRDGSNISSLSNWGGGGGEKDRGHLGGKPACQVKNEKTVQSSILKCKQNKKENMAVGKEGQTRPTNGWGFRYKGGGTIKATLIGFPK